MFVVSVNKLSMIMELAEEGDLYQSILKRQGDERHFEEIDIWNMLIQILRGL